VEPFQFGALAALALGAAAFAAESSSRQKLLWIACAFAAGLYFTRGAARIGPEFSGGLVLLFSALGLSHWRRWGSLSPLAAGLSAALLARGLESELGIPGIYWPAAAAAILVLGTAWTAIGNPRFATVWLRKEALAGVGALALVVGAAPGVSSGWSTALTLSAKGAETAVTIPQWVWILAGVSLTVGALQALWKYR
jgi:hypothetical protein